MVIVNAVVLVMLRSNIVCGDYFDENEECANYRVTIVLIVVIVRIMVMIMVMIIHPPIHRIIDLWNNIECAD